jgi:large subunit ribosomal protein L19
MANAVDLIRSVEQLKEQVPELAPGDTVKVHVRIVGHQNVYRCAGVIIGLRGSSLNKALTVRRIASQRRR